MTSIVGLRGYTPPNQNGSDPEIIKYLENILTMARDGDILAVGVLVIGRDGHVFTNHRGRNHKHELVACCEYLKHDLCELP